MDPAGRNAATHAKSQWRRGRSKFRSTSKFDDFLWKRKFIFSFDILWANGSAFSIFLCLIIFLFFLRNLQPQDPPAYGADFSKATREIIRLRYQMIPYLYTLFYKSHAYGGSVIRPLSFKYVLIVQWAQFFTVWAESRFGHVRRQMKWKFTMFRTIDFVSNRYSSDTSFGYSSDTNLNILYWFNREECFAVFRPIETRSKAKNK